MGRVTALSRAVTTVTWMSHGSHEPDVDESRLEHALAGPWYQCLSSKQTLFALGQHAGSEPDAGSRTAPSSSATFPAPIWPLVRHKLCPYIGQVRRRGLYYSIQGNNVKIGQFQHLPYYLFRLLPEKGVCSSVDPFSERCRNGGRKSNFRVSQNESKIQNIFPLLMIHFVVYLIDFEKGLTVLRT